MKTNPMTFILIGAVIAVLGGLITAIGTFLYNRKSSEKTDRIVSGINKGVDISQKTNDDIAKLESLNIDLNKKLENQKTIIDNLRAENADLYAKLAEASKTIYNNITGGESYCVLEVSFYNVKNRQPTFGLRHVGDYPLRNISIRIDDLGRRKYLIENTAIKDYKSPMMIKICEETVYELNYNCLHPKSSINNIVIPFEEKQEEINFRIWIYQENGSLFETLHVTNFRISEKMVYQLELKKGGKILESRSNIKTPYNQPAADHVGLRDSK